MSVDFRSEEPHEGHQEATLGDSKSSAQRPRLDPEPWMHQSHRGARGRWFSGGHQYLTGEREWPLAMFAGLRGVSDTFAVQLGNIFEPVSVVFNVLRASRCKLQGRRRRHHRSRLRYYR